MKCQNYQCWMFVRSTQQPIHDPLINTEQCVVTQEFRVPPDNHSASLHDDFAVPTEEVTEVVEPMSRLFHVLTVPKPSKNIN